MTQPDPLRRADPLVDISLDDLLDALGLASPRGAWLRPLLRPTARRFAGTVREFDNRVAHAGLAGASDWLLQRMAGGLQVAGQAQVPASGPLLVLANHPGMTDTAALFASLPMRADLRVIALDRPFLRALPHVAARMIFASDDGPSRLRAVRTGIAHLRQGGALLTFPAGAIEPDPAAAGNRAAIDALAGWSGSFALLARAAPDTRIVPAIVRQVVSAQALQHPLTRLRAAAADREKLAAALQILWRRYRRMPARVGFGAPLTLRDCGPAGLHQAVLARASGLMDTTDPHDHPSPTALRY